MKKPMGWNESRKSNEDAIWVMIEARDEIRPHGKLLSTEEQAAWMKLGRAIDRIQKEWLRMAPGKVAV